ncbi:MAG TPA: PQQ-binding-like beta-propeller repeat protein [Vicinamibacterales bacterium]|nr:PQQ-binding-like beta-propeller repeat protein [Vicinamibacterales bacterium]
MTFRLALALVCSTVILQAQTRPADWPQWRGANRDGAATGFSEPKTWPQTLARKWKVPVGLGYATPLLVGNRLYTFTRVDGNETVQALDAGTGKVIWQTGYPAPFRMNPAAARHGEGPKSTPTFAGGKLYTLGMTGIVSAFDAATGKRLWQTSPSAAQPLYHTAQSPLVDRGLVIVHVGGHNQGALSAFDANTGAVTWTWNGDGPSYGSPIALDVAGTRQIITFSQENLVGVSAATGELLWKRPFNTRSTQNTITPIVYGDTLIVSGLEKPITAFRILKQGKQWTTENVWENSDVSLYMSNAVLVRDALCGMSNRNSGQFFCLDAKSGKTLWTSEPRQATNAAVVRAGDVWFALQDDGELIVLRGTASAFEPVKRYTVADSATWAQPVIAGNRIYVKDVADLTLWAIE